MCEDERTRMKCIQIRDAAEVTYVILLQIKSFISHHCRIQYEPSYRIWKLKKETLNLVFV